MGDGDRHFKEGPDNLLLDHLELFSRENMRGPVLDLACGNGHNGVFLGTMGLEVVLADISKRALDRARALARKRGVSARIWQVDLEEEERNPLAPDAFGAVLVFRYLHRPLIPCIKKAMVPGGVLVYETFTAEQSRFGKPRNPDHLLKPGELLGWFKEWKIIHHFEGIKGHPRKAIAQIVCTKAETE
jgi:tellurite methyltransferase